MRNLWCDQKTNKDKIEFLKSGRAFETGIMAQGIIPEITETFIELERLREIVKNFSDSGADK